MKAKELKVDSSLLVMMFRKGTIITDPSGVSVEIIEGIPDDAKLDYATNDIFNVISFRVRSESFPEVVSGGPFPIVEVMLREMAKPVEVHAR